MMRNITTPSFTVLLFHFDQLAVARQFSISRRDAIAIDAACALTVHAIYRRFEYDASHIIWHLSFLIGTPSILTATFMNNSSTSTASLFSFSIFYLVLLVNIILYRFSPWHPLAKYPGLIVARVSKLWGAIIMAKGKNHENFKRLHDKYGPYVRIGPNEISGPMWSARNSQSNTPPLIALRTKEEHARRRKPWNHAFNTVSVKGYESIIEKRAVQLVHELEKRSVSKASFRSECVETVNLSQWLSFFTTDFMGDMAFGGGFELMRNGGDTEGIWTIIESGFVFLAFFQHFPWIVPLFRKFGIAGKQLTRFRDFARERVRMRKLNGSVSKDLFYHLIDEDNVQKQKPSESEVISEGGLAIVAGSDTTATVLSGLFYYILRDPKEYDCLQKEVDFFFPPGDGSPFDSNEAMRLQPPVPTYLQRAPEEGSGGKWVTDSFIPEGTSVVVPPYVVMRSSEYFSPDPEKFWPERWLKLKPEKQASTDKGDCDSHFEDSSFTTNTSAFIPFSYGPANCAGKLLAIVEMRMVVALLMQRFEIRFADGYDPLQWETELKDYFVMSNGCLPVVMAPRL
ncbi:high nitrogen upregulated cytochrome P450 monooxygenase 2 [Pyrrhoderma noxium]|uniref:High nitrogen upregulated cytochrome P450 monooxygenase 2 n=1 Tax=Pyrrhoderma noxium TaxID=2282107 RepID=A0A286U9Z1_9AGAM|nr:high nitrogen upregulated cytochrome P450 monooxygenase 2 [Pyrrhoderma noxium]